MSTNESFTGMSVKLADNVANDGIKLSEIAKYLDYPEDLIERFKSGEKEDIVEAIYDSQEKNKWRLMYDYDSNIGLVYVKESENDVFDINYQLSLEEMNVILGKLADVLPKEYINMDAANVKAFAYLYYNGSECPFKF